MCSLLHGHFLGREAKEIAWFGQQSLLYDPKNGRDEGWICSESNLNKHEIFPNLLHCWWKQFENKPLTKVNLKLFTKALSKPYFIPKLKMSFLLTDYCANPNALFENV